MTTAEMRVQERECDKHGAYEAKVFDLMGREIVSGCPKCDELRRAEDEAREARQRALDREAALSRMMSASHIPARFADKSLDNFQAETPKQKAALSVARGLATTKVPGASAIFCGRPGTGKTHLACGACRAFIESGRSARFVTVLAAIRHVRDTYRKDSLRSESEALQDFLRPELLVLDEVGVQVGSEHEKMMLFEIINERYQECRSTILISNLTRAELTEYLGQRVMDRFAEGGAVVAFDWNSHRGRQCQPA